MSGFGGGGGGFGGGGFGGGGFGPPAPPGPFGTPSQPPAPFGSGPASNPAPFGGFGSSSNSPPVAASGSAPFGGSGFGPGFGTAAPSPIPPPVSSPFGSPPAFGQQANQNLTQPPATFPLGASSTSAAPSQGHPSFGSSPNVMTPASSGFGGGGGGFGQTIMQPNLAPFGGSVGFGGGEGGGTGVGFGSSSAGFGSTFRPASSHPPAPFGTGHTTDGMVSNGTPFGPAAAPSGPAVTFGSSSNVVTASGSGFGTSSAPSSSTGFGGGIGGASGQGGGRSGFGSSGFSSVGASGGGFGSTSGTGGGGFGSATGASGGGFGSTTVASGGGYGRSHNSGVGFGSTSSGSTNPFGSSMQTTESNNSMRDQYHGSRQSFGRSRVSPIPSIQEEDDDEEETTMAGNDYVSTDYVGRQGGLMTQAGPSEEERLKAMIEEKKRQLQTRIEEKKRRLAEKQKLKLQQSGHESQPRDDQDAGTDSERRSKPWATDAALSSSTFSTHSQSLAERNVHRFSQQGQDATASATRSLLPTGMRDSKQQQQPKPYSSTSDISPVQESEREDLENAVSLVGTCPHMCPDDELLRRQLENDIQALEIPSPGTLHPQGWTMRDTVVKRFRRSAADYKLDIPEWVRPPDVLERTCAYLEEWVMERDRQGPDPRFPQNATPPPLDVYQFIWDRTRMIRKDFILQNYVGTGGLCDARAVRCHERIARWHAMCEHQLSHIPDFVTMQSQQNIQELGQTMKTLNQFYDDSLHRSTVEVPDERGRETRQPSIMANYAAGCRTETVQGQGPIDYNGTPLQNTSDNPMIALRLIGKDAIYHPSRGTAEPEMRALYILLTLDNEGGMEVLKYAAKLFKQRPDVYHSAPVQLALTIFKAKKDFNYVKFFSIMRSPSTPYLFCCVMFKHVELMRKVAFRIMSKTYGAKNKDTGEAMYDQYPLERLVKLLCFEDFTEARQACNHYNIAVKEHQTSSGGIVEVIYWRVSNFREPKHPEKGHTLYLQPWKMVRTVERKLNGATRLGVCRGEVSGDGSALSAPLSATDSESHLHATSVVTNITSTTNLATIPAVAGPDDGFTEAISIDETRAKARALLGKQKLERAKLEKQMEDQEAKERQTKLENEREKERIQLQEEKRVEEKRRRDEIERQNQVELEDRRRAEEQRQEAERQNRLKEEERQRVAKQEELERHVAEEKARKMEEERRIRLAEVEAKKQQALEEKRRQEEADRLEREHQRQIAEETRRRELAAEQRRKEEEQHRLEALRRELEERRRREAEEKRKEKEWQDKVDAATKLVVWRRWQRALSRQLELTFGSKKSLHEIDPFYETDSCDMSASLREAMTVPHAVGRAPKNPSPSARKILEQLTRQKAAKVSISEMAIAEVEALSKVGRFNRAKSGDTETTLLLKIALICPETEEITDASIATLVCHWIGSRVDVGKIDRKSGKSYHLPYEVRSVVIKAVKRETCSDCDIALLVLPPQWSDCDKNAGMLESFSSSILDEDIPRVVLVLRDQPDKHSIPTINKDVAAQLGGSMDDVPIVQPEDLSVEAFENALHTTFKKAVNLFVHDVCVHVNRVPVLQLATNTIMAILWRCIPTIGSNGDEDLIVECSRVALIALIDELGMQARLHKEEWAHWPPLEFAPNGRYVKSYFTEDLALPLKWIRCLSRGYLEESFAPLIHVFDGHFRDVFQRILADAPTVIRDDCASQCAQGNYRRCLEKSLMWLNKGSAGNRCLYIPDGLQDVVIESVVAKVQDIPALKSARKRKVPTLTRAVWNDEEVFGEEEIPEDFFHENTTRASPMTSNKRQRNNHSRNESAAAGMAQMSDEVRNTQESLTPEEPSSPIPPHSEDLMDSDAFSKKLERMLYGETIDISVGSTSLAHLLRDVPAIDIPRQPAHT